MSSSYWCRLAWTGGERALPGVLVEVEGERIAGVREGVESCPRGAERLDGLTIPGFANAHSHAFQRALRGRTQGERGSFWTWREAMYAAASRLDPDGYRALARATYAEMALAGITAVGEFHYLHHAPDGSPYDEPNEIGLALIEAAAQAGLRITLVDACYLHGGIGEEPSEVQRRFSDGSAESWAERVDALTDGPASRIGAAIHSVRAVDPESAAVVSAWARNRSRPLHAHVSEQRAENEQCEAALARTPTQVLADAGATGAGFTAVHATHLADGDVPLLAEGCCCVCPTTERDLADGIGPARRLAEAGAALALGSDSNAIIDPLCEARAVELDERLASEVRGNHLPVDLLRAATEAGHVSIGWPEAGRIAPGAIADLVTVGLDGPRLAGTGDADAIDALVFAGTNADIRRVIVGGRTIVEGGVHLGIDVAGELERSIGELAA